MGILYQLLHQTYKLRHPVVKQASRIRRLFRARPPQVHAGTHLDLDFLFPNSTGHESLRDHHVIRGSLLRFMVKYFAPFLFFKTDELAPNQRVIPVSFRMLKLSYRGVADLDVSTSFPAQGLSLEEWTPEMLSFFRYKFTKKYFVTAYTTVRLSADRQRRVSQLAFLHALLVRLSHHDFEQPAPAMHLISPSLPQDFLKVMSDELPFVFSPVGPAVVYEPLPFAAIAGLDSRREALLNTLFPEDSDYESSEDESDDDVREVPAPAAAADTHRIPVAEHECHPVFHRYVLSGRGLDHGLVTPTRGVMNKLYNKGRTPRNKQIYRTGVFWCLWLTVITVVGPFYVFYGFTFIYTHLYIFPLAVLARLGLVAVARFFDLSAKQVWVKLCNHF